MSFKPKVLFLLHLPPPIHGSSVVGMSIKNSQPINDAFECAYINLLASTKMGEEGKINFKKIFDFTLSFGKLTKTIIKNRPRLCYFALTCKGAAFYRDFLLVFLLKLFQIDIVYHLHNKGIAEFKKKGINRLLYSFVFKNEKVILLSQHLYYDVQEFVKETEIFICPNGIPEINGLNVDAMNAKRMTRTVPGILFLSNLLKQKGVFTLLEACKILLERNISFETIFVGSPADITESEFKEYIVRNKLEHNVFYAGRKYNEEKLVYFQQANLFVLPTHNETFGLVNLEAMQFGLPIISTNEGGIPDIVENNFNGFIVPQKDSKFLADKLELLVTNLEKCVVMGNRGRNIFEAKFTLQKFENTMVQILQQVVGLNRNP